MNLRRGVLGVALFVLVLLPTFGEEAPEAVVFPGEPAITLRDVANHVRLLEFLLGCRATRAQPVSPPPSLSKPVSRPTSGGRGEAVRPTGVSRDRVAVARSHFVW